MHVEANKLTNLKHAGELIDTAISQAKGLKLVVLPECFNSPYGITHFNENAETVPDGKTCQMLSKKAKEHGIYLVGGTFPERKAGKLYNTCTVWDPRGNLLATYRKIHLFDIDIPGKMTFKESEILSAGNNLATFECEGIKVGLGICYDIRFPELARLYRMKHKCDMLIIPGAFNLTTGPLHWRLLQRARAVDCQMYVLAVSPATGDQGYRAYGHSAITDPWGKHTSLEHKEDLLCQNLSKQ